MTQGGEEPSRVAIDLVDVIEDSWQQKRRWMAEALRIDLGSLPRSRVWIERRVEQGCSGQDGYDCYEAMSEAINTPESVSQRRPVRGAVQGLERLREDMQIVVVSGRREEKRAVTMAWLAANGLGWISPSDLVLLGFRASRHQTEPPLSKLAWCARNGIDALVDNQARQLARGAAQAPEVLRVLFSADPEEAAARDRGVLIARTWAEVVRVLRQSQRPQLEATS